MSQSPSPESSAPAQIDRLDVDSGEYFRNGRSWSRLMFEAPIIERSYLLLYLCIIAFTLAITTASWMSLFPLSAPVRMIFTNDNSGFDYPRLVRIHAQDESLQHSLARYIAQQYVIAYESYLYDRNIIDQRYRFVYNQSAADVFQQYRSTLDTNNPQSPLNTLEQTGTRNIYDPYARITNETAAGGVVSMTAEVYYSEATTQKEMSLVRKKATMQFSMHEITVHKPSKSVYQYNPATGTTEKLKDQILFRVNSYKTGPAKATNNANN